MIFDVDQRDFNERVVERSRQVPVVVDFWAQWCGPCKALSPALETAASSRDGQIDLAKIDVDSSPGIAQSYRVQGIPNVKAFRDGRVVDEFTGALPAPEVEKFFDRLVPSEAETLASEGARLQDEGKLRRALELDARNLAAAQALGRILIQRGDTDEAEQLLSGFEYDFVALGLSSRARLEAGEQPPLEAFEAWDGGDYERALELLQADLEGSSDERRDLVRQVMVAIFSELGSESELARRYRRKLSMALF
jgi:putative thioredoxin